MLPPGRSANPVPGISPSLEPELYEAAGELNAWIDYLLDPHSNDGPRIYRPRGQEGRGPSDLEMPGRVDNLDEQDHIYDTVSVLDDYKDDPGVFFRSAQAVAGVVEKIIEGTYDKLATGVLTWHKEGVARASNVPDEQPDGKTGGGDNHDKPVEGVPYPELHPARFNWTAMRNGWHAPENLAASDYEGDFIAFQVLTENAVYEVAKHVVRYRTMFMKAGEDIARLMKALTEKFANPPNEGVGGGVKFDFPSILINAIVSAATTILTGGAGLTVKELLKSATSSALSSAMTSTKVTRQLDVHQQFYDTAKQYVDGVEKIEKETADAIKELTDHMRSEIEKLRDQRTYLVFNSNFGSHTEVPRIQSYLDALPK